MTRWDVLTVHMYSPVTIKVCHNEIHLLYVFSNLLVHILILLPLVVCNSYCTLQNLGKISSLSDTCVGGCSVSDEHPVQCCVLHTCTSICAIGNIPGGPYLLNA